MLLPFKKGNRVKIPTKEQVKNLSSDNITKKEYDKTIDLISDRVDYIWRQIIKISRRELSWYAFQNDVELGSGNGSTGGFFNPETDSEFIEFTGKFSYLENPYYEYNDGFPTSFLWTDDESWTTEVIQNLNEMKAKLKTDKSDLKREAKEKLLVKEKIIESIKAKLSKEELKYIEFKK